MPKKEITQHQALVNLYNTLSNEELMDLIKLASNRIFIFNPNDRTCYDIDMECPACINGPQIQICIKEE